MTSFIWPARGPISSPFGPRDVAGISTNHRGIDIAVADKTSVVASASGRIIAQGILGIGGNTIIIDHGDGLSTLYAHLSKFTQMPFSRVTQGQQIALSGGLLGDPGAGNSRGAHLHFEIRDRGKHLDPLTLLSVGVGEATMSPLTPENAQEIKDRADRNKNSDKWWWIGSGENLPGMRKTGEIVDSVKGPINLVSTVGGFIINPDNWKRIGLGALGITLLVIALIELLASDGAVKTIVKAAV